VSGGKDALNRKLTAMFANAKTQKAEQQAKIMQDCTQVGLGNCLFIRESECVCRCIRMKMYVCLRRNMSDYKSSVGAR
jgi:hypothetical protein